eukprot:CAMPEP_0170526302 /NCGR_PEP_ID=MMETSP0209-20121228/11752_1 /TAXON_ID=665100 ORGANISM="Litonotus pictus, Strain P1" /NCGR_SAMPLE_ID=MMETSP0209 /ASSEMBLY_ACC=CAM_ASM_000301 /LENGTH=306 /DNA_ID=CAMNT_0010816059 /DNA_START=167 /DNA_END=1084 /DNA_ORIENTATION=+
MKSSNNKENSSNEKNDNTLDLEELKSFLLNNLAVLTDNKAKDKSSKKLSLADSTAAEASAIYKLAILNSNSLPDYKFYKLVMSMKLPNLLPVSSNSYKVLLNKEQTTFYHIYKTVQLLLLNDYLEKQKPIIQELFLNLLSVNKEKHDLKYINELSKFYNVFTQKYFFYYFTIQEIPQIQELRLKNHEFDSAVKSFEGKSEEVLFSFFKSSYFLSVYLASLMITDNSELEKFFERVRFHGNSSPMNIDLFGDESVKGDIQRKVQMKNVAEEYIKEIQQSREEIMSAISKGKTREEIEQLYRYISRSS